MITTTRSTGSVSELAGQAADPSQPLLGCHNNRSGSAGDAQDNKGSQQAGDAGGYKGEQIIAGLAAYRACAKGGQRSADLMKSKNPGDDDRRVLAAEYFIR